MHIKAIAGTMRSGRRNAPAGLLAGAAAVLSRNVDTEAGKRRCPRCPNRTCCVCAPLSKTPGCRFGPAATEGADYIARCERMCGGAGTVAFANGSHNVRRYHGLQLRRLYEGGLPALLTRRPRPKPTVALSDWCTIIGSPDRAAAPHRGRTHLPNQPRMPLSFTDAVFLRCDNWRTRPRRGETGCGVRHGVPAAAERRR